MESSASCHDLIIPKEHALEMPRLQSVSHAVTTAQCEVSVSKLKPIVAVEKISEMEYV